MSIIALEKLNSILVNRKADKVIAAFSKKNPDLIFDSDRNVHLVKIILRVAGFKKNARVPFYAFVKRAGEYVAVVDVETGAAQVIDPSVIASETDVKGNFRIDGVTYGLKDTVDGFKRYRPLSCEPKRPRRKLKVNSPEVVGDAD